MKAKSLIGYRFKFVFLPGIMLFSSPLLNAWTVTMLDPTATVSGSRCNDSKYTVFRSYLTEAGSSLTAGSLASYTVGSADAVIVNVAGLSTHYSSVELAVLSSLLNSNTRVLIFGENNSWTSSNGDLATLLGGVNGNRDGNAIQTVANVYPLITEGVSSIEFLAPGVILPGASGLSLSDDNSLTLWGNNDNFLLLMDINFLDNDGISRRADNDTIAKNIANWLSGAITPVPEPSSYALVMGMAGLGALAIRRRRK